MRRDFQAKVSGKNSLECLRTGMEESVAGAFCMEEWHHGISGPDLRIYKAVAHDKKDGKSLNVDKQNKGTISLIKCHLLLAWRKQATVQSGGALRSL